MTQMLESEARAKARLNDAIDASNLWDDGSDEESDDDGPGAHNSTTIRALSPTPIRVEIPARYQPLLLAVHEATPATMSDARWSDVVERLQRNGTYASLSYLNFEEYLIDAKKENMPVMYNTDRKGEINMVWTYLPFHWVQPNPTMADEHRNANGRGATPQQRSDEYKQSLKIMHGSTNITTEIVKAVLHLSKHHNHPIRINYVAERIGPHMVIVVQHVVRLLRVRGLLIDWDDKNYVWILRGLVENKSEMLRATFKKHLIGRNSRKRAKELVEKDFWEEDPNIFLIFHTTNFAQLVDQARKSTDCVKMTAGNEVLWTE